MNKKEMVTEICKRLNERGFVGDDGYGADESFSPEYGFGAGLEYLPKENLSMILECDISDCKNFNEAYQHWGRIGALRFEPYITYDTGNPTLVIRHNRYLHMFRGYHFQVSTTVDGIGDAYSNSYRMDFMIGRGENDMLSRGLIGYMLWWASLIDAGFRYDNFVKLFDEKREVLEKFLKESAKYWGSHFDYSWDDIAEYIEFSKGTIDNCRKIYHLTYDDDSAVYAHFAIGENTVEIERPGCSLLTITVPDLTKGTSHHLRTEYSRDLYECDKSYLEANHYLEIITVMGFAMCGINVNFMGWYTKDGEYKAMRKVNKPNVKNVTSLNDIYGCEPDEF